MIEKEMDEPKQIGPALRFERPMSAELEAVLSEGFRTMLPAIGEITGPKGRIVIRYENFE